MTTSWLGQFLPHISIYNRIFCKAEMGGENTSWYPHKNMCTLNKPVSKAETKTGVPAKAFRHPLQYTDTLTLGGSGCSVFPPPPEDQLSLK